MNVPWYPCWAISWRNPETSPPLIDTLLEHRPDDRWVIAPNEIIRSEQHVWSCWLKTVDDEMHGLQIARSIDVSMLCALHGTRKISDALASSSITPKIDTVAWLLHLPFADPSLIDGEWHLSELPFPEHTQEIEQVAWRIIEALEAFVIPTRPGGVRENHDS